jgi:Clustered mitochondria
MHAQAELPLAEGTLRIGSQDAGVTVLDHDPELRGKLRLVAAQLNLKPHLGRGLVQLQLGCDVEGHRGTDGNLYVVRCQLHVDRSPYACSRQRWCSCCLNLRCTAFTALAL